jgi:formylglycine-generating enzyme required for sulfatase activity
VKAAYHKNDGVTANYWHYPTSTDAPDFPISDQPPGSGAPRPWSTANFRDTDGAANGYNDGFAVTGSNVFSSTQNYLTDVGAYTSTVSPYGTFDQAGNVWEWNEAVLVNPQPFRGMRGGSWTNSSFIFINSYRGAYFPTYKSDLMGFRVASIPEPSTGLLGLLASIGMLLRRSAASRLPVLYSP